jgi:PAS domain S-box-containing protein
MTATAGVVTAAGTETFVIALDAEGRIVLFNPACESLTGYVSDEVRGRHMLSLLVPDASRATVAADLAAAPDGPAPPRVSRWRTKSGEERAIAWRYYRIPGCSGSTIVGVGREVAGAAPMAAERPTGERLLRDIMDYSDAVIYLKDTTGRYIDVNRHFERLTHTRREDVVGKTDYDVFPREYADTYRANDRRALSEGRPVHTEETALLDDTVRTFLEVKFPVFDADGSAYGVCGIATDITERKRAEALLHESEAHFREVMQALPIGAWTNLPDGRIDFVNRHWLEYTGQTLEVAAGTPGAWISAVHPEERPRARAFYTEALRAGREFTAEIRFRRAADNTYRCHLVSALPLRDARNRVFKWVGTCTDIEAQKQMEATLRDASRRKDRFLAVLGHELRNPLGVVLTGLEVLERITSLTPDAVKVRALIRRQVEHLARLLDDLIDVTRVVQGKIDLRRQPVDLRAVVDVAVQSERLRFADKAQRLDVVVPPEPVTIDGDQARLQQIVGNLLNNAVKYTPAGGAISVSLQRDAGDAVLRVEDSGPGIPPDRLGSIFELFTQVHPGAAAGLGVGLALVKRLVDLHGGIVEAESEGEGHGSRFTVRLPLAPANGAAPEPTASRPGDRALRVLVIEDNADARDVLQLGLSLAGHQADTAADGAAGLARACATHPDAVLVDIALPDVDGYEVARGIRKELGSGPLLIALTGYGRPEDRRRASEAGFDAHVTKPATVEQIVRLLSRERTV